MRFPTKKTWSLIIPADTQKLDCVILLELPVTRTPCWFDLSRSQVARERSRPSCIIACMVDEPLVGLRQGSEGRLTGYSEEKRVTKGTQHVRVPSPWHPHATHLVWQPDCLRDEPLGVHSPRLRNRYVLRGHPQLKVTRQQHKHLRYPSTW